MKIEIQPRLHLGLISMHAEAKRRNGGLGFAIAAPTGVVTCRSAQGFSFDDRRDVPLSDMERQRIEDAVNDARETHRLDYSVDAVLKGNLLTHVGMGLGTAIRLAVLESLFVLNGREATPEDLIASSQRGGTSGIGIRTYFNGGFVFDLGVPQQIGGHLPSSQAMPSKPPLVLHQLAMPDWPLCLVVPKGLAPKTQYQEVEFFKRVTPLRDKDSFEAAYHALFGVSAALVEADYSNFCSAVTDLQSTKWKSLEWSEYGSGLYKIADHLRGLGADCVGLSSLGPMLFAFGDEATLAKVAAEASPLDASVIRTRPCNTGRRVLGK
ncbi:MAG: beta-ribofuranosylaminobenzene 5'-phosphate synthase family protein [Pseudomonadota bacterium]